LFPLLLDSQFKRLEKSFIQKVKATKLVEIRKGNIPVENFRS